MRLLSLNLSFAPLILTAVLVTASCGGGGGGSSQSPAPVNTNKTPSFSSNTSLNVEENTSGSIHIVEAVDPDDDSLTYLLDPEFDGEFFSLDSVSGQLTIINPLNFESPVDVNSDNVYELAISVSDGKGGEDHLQLLVTIADKLEFTIGAYVSKGPVTGADCDLLSISNSGELGAILATGESLDGQINFGSEIDYDGPAIIICRGGSYIDEATGIETVSSILRSVVDVNSNNTFTVSALTEIAVSTAESEGNLLSALETYNNAVASSFGIQGDITEIKPIDIRGAATGTDEASTYAAALAIISQLNSESLLDLHTLLAEFVVDFRQGGTLSEVKREQISRAQVNFLRGDSPFLENVSLFTFDTLNELAEIPNNTHTPVITSSRSITVPENTSGSIYSVTAFDLDNDSLSYSIVGGNDGSLFSLTANGELSFIASPNFEIPSDINVDNIYEVELIASDGALNSEILSLEISVVNINDAPKFSITETAFSAEENQISTNVNVSAFDEDGDDLLFGLLESQDHQLFTINSNSGVINFIDEPNFEVPSDLNGDNVYVIGLIVEDVEGESDTVQIEINVQNGNDLPVFVSVNETSVIENSTDVDYLILVEDEDSDEISISTISGPDADKFIINENSNELDLLGPLDFETPTDSDSDNIYELTLSATDGHEVVTFDLSVYVTDQASLGLIVDFPSEGANVGGESEYISITGRLIDEEDGIVSNNDVQQLTVSSDATSFVGAANIFGDANDQWTIEVPIQLDSAIDIILDITDLNNTTGSLTHQFTNKLIPFGNRNTISDDLAYDESREIIYVYSEYDQAIYTIDRNSGAVEKLGDKYYIEDIEFNSVSSKIIAIDSFHELVSIDIETGSVEEITPKLYGSNSFNFAIDMTLTNDGLTAYVIDRGITGKLLKVEIETGIVTVIAEFDELSQAVGLTLDEINQIAYTSWCSTCRVVSIDLNTGEYELGPFTPVTSLFRDMKFNPQTGLIYISDVETDQILTYDPINETYSAVLITAPESTDFFKTPNAIVLDSASNSFLIADSESCGIFSLSLATAEAQNIYGCGVGTGPNFTSPNSVELDEINERLYFADDNNAAIYSFDLDTSIRRLLSNFSKGEGEDFCTVNDIAFSGGRLLVVDSCNKSVYEINIETGDRTTIVSNSFGSGVDLESPRGLELSLDTNQLFLTEVFNNNLISVDLETGYREVVSGNSIGSGPQFIEPREIELDLENNRIFVENYSYYNLTSVDLITGDREIVSELGHNVGLTKDEDNAIIYFVASNQIFGLDLISNQKFQVSTSSNNGYIRLFLTPAGGIEVDNTKNKIYWTSEVFGGLVEVDLVSGDRALISR